MELNVSEETEEYFENKAIKLLFVGDTNQAIYGGIGGLAKNISELNSEFETKFIPHILNGCYRSSQKIIDFYSEFQVEDCSIESKARIENNLCKVVYENKISKDQLIPKIAYLVQMELDKKVPESEICILAPQWWLLFPFSKAIKEILPNVKFDAPDMPPFKCDPLNIFYLITKLVFTKPSSKTQQRKRCASEVLKIIAEEYGYNIVNIYCSLDSLNIINSVVCNNQNGMDHLKNCIGCLFDKLSIDLENDQKLLKAYSDYILKSEERMRNNNLSDQIDFFNRCFQEKEGIVINTFHGIRVKNSQQL